MLCTFSFPKEWRCNKERLTQSNTGVYRENTKPCSFCSALDAYSGITKGPVGMHNPTLKPHHLQHTWSLLSWLPDSSSWHLEHPRVPLNLRLHTHLFTQHPLGDSDLATLYLVLPTFYFSPEVYVAVNLHDLVALLENQPMWWLPTLLPAPGFGLTMLGCSCSSLSPP